MIVLVLLVSAGLGWHVRSARIPREAVAAITEAGGTIEYDWEWHDGKEIPGGTPWAPPWLVNAIGVDFFGHITFVELYATANDAVLVEVGRLARPQAVILTNSPVSDVGLEHLTGLTNLSRLDLSLTELTDSGLAHLKGLTYLSHLDLMATQVTDAGLAHLNGLANISELDLSGTQVANVGAAELRRALPKLTITIYR